MIRQEKNYHCKNCYVKTIIKMMIKWKIKICFVDYAIEIKKIKFKMKHQR